MQEKMEFVWLDSEISPVMGDPLSRGSQEEVQVSPSWHRGGIAELSYECMGSRQCP